MKKNFKKVLSLALAFAMSFAAFAPTMVKAALEKDYALADCVKVTNQFGDTEDTQNAELKFDVLVQKDVPQGADKNFNYWTDSEKGPVTELAAKLVLNSNPKQGEDFKRYTLKTSDDDKAIKLPEGKYNIEVTNFTVGQPGVIVFKLSGQGSNLKTKIEVLKQQDSNGIEKLVAKMADGVDHIRVFQETSVADTKLVKLVLLETVNGKKGAPIANAFVNIKVDGKDIGVFSNEKGEVQLQWKGTAPTEAKIMAASGYVFETGTGSKYRLFADAKKSKKIVLNNQNAATNNGTYEVNEDGVFYGLNANLTKEVYLEKEPGDKQGTLVITAMERDPELVQKPVKGIEYTLYKGSEVAGKAETNEYGQAKITNLAIPKKGDFKEPFVNEEELKTTYSLKQTKVPAGYVQDNKVYTVEFSVTRTAADTYVPDITDYDKPVIVNVRFDIDAPELRDLAGYNRFGTAAKISQKVYDTASIGNDTKKVPAIVIVNGLDFADGLAAGPFAKSLEGKNPLGNTEAAYKTAPILLVEKNEIPKETLKEIKRLTNDKEGAALKKTEIYVIGGENAVSTKVINELNALKGINKVNVLAGRNRYETAAIVAKETVKKLSIDPAEIVLVNGGNFADALGGGTLAIAKDDTVLLLNHPTEHTPEVANFIEKNSTIQKVLVLGGVNAISEQAVAGYKAPITRVFGADRYETSVKVAELITGATDAYVSSGLTFADALALTPYIRMSGANGIILLTAQNELPIAVRRFLNTNKDTFKEYDEHTFIVGGENAVSAEVERVLKEEVFK